jgi:preprotein translocase subunit YajC
MELLIFVALLLLFVAIIVVAIFITRPARRQAADLAAGTNKPDDRNAFGPSRDDRG